MGVCDRLLLRWCHLECFLSLDLGCLDEQSICILVGRLMTTFKVLLCGRRRLHALYGVYGRKWMIEVLRIVRRFWKILIKFYFQHNIFGQLFLFLIWWLIIMIFLFFLSLQAKQEKAETNYTWFGIRHLHLLLEKVPKRLHLIS